MPRGAGCPCEDGFMRRLVVVLILLASAPAYAAFHAMKVVEVFPGSTSAPNAQYVVLQMFANGQNQVQTHRLFVFNATGGTITSFMFTAPVANGASQSRILIATAEAQ